VADGLRLGWGAQGMQQAEAEPPAAVDLLPWIKQAQ
jgi:hypothetical protein